MNFETPVFRIRSRRNRTLSTVHYLGRFLDTIWVSKISFVVLSLIFLKFVSDKFEERRAGGKKEVSTLHHSSFPLFPPRARHFLSMLAKWDP